MSAAASVLMMRNFSKMFLRARQALEFSHGLDPKPKSAARRKSSIGCLAIHSLASAS
jgi:hypothetical protein